MPEQRDATPPAPSRPIRRFDVFAEVKRLEALAQGRPADEAKGYGIWIAKVVAGRRFGRKAAAGEERPRPRPEEGIPPAEAAGGKFRHAGDELQTDETFDREVVDRMGEQFYERVFAPTIRAALDGGERYEQFRDTIRADWKPARRAGRG